MREKYFGRSGECSGFAIRCGPQLTNHSLGVSAKMSALRKKEREAAAVNWVSIAKAQGLTGQGAKGLEGYRGLLTPGWGPELGPIARHAPGLSIELLLFSGPGLSQAVLT